MTVSIIRKGAILAACLTALGTWTVAAEAASQSITVALSGTQQVPPVQTTATGTADLTYDPATRVLTWNLNYSGLSGPATMVHFHGPADAGKNGPPVIWLSPKGSPVQVPVKGEATLTPEQAQQFSAGEWYINVHTQDHQAGEIRGQVTPPKSLSRHAVGTRRPQRQRCGRREGSVQFARSAARISLRLSGW